MAVLLYAVGNDTLRNDDNKVIMSVVVCFNGDSQVQKLICRVDKIKTAP